MIPLKTAKKAAQYPRDFVRANTGEWAEMMRGVNPRQGYGNGKDAADAFDAAMFLYHETDEHFLSFQIPGEFACGDAFGSMPDDDSDAHAGAESRRVAGGHDAGCLWRRGVPGPSRA